MSSLDICTVALDVPGYDSAYIGFDEEVSLLDADIVLFSPEPNFFSPTERQGKPLLGEHSSMSVRKQLKHWRSELIEAFKGGATVIIFLTKYQEAVAATGEEKYTGTGRFRKRIPILNVINNYFAIPIKFQKISISRGEKIRLTGEGRTILGQYWRVMQPCSHYEVYYELENYITLATTKIGNKIVSSFLTNGRGNLLLLPSVDFDAENNLFETEEGEFSWSNDAIRKGKAFIGTLIAISKALRSEQVRSPAPSWIAQDEYTLAAEAVIEKRLGEIKQTVKKLRDEQVDLEEQLVEKTLLKGLLFETGTALELAVLEALRIIGFTADQYQDSESELDAVFESSEGRFIGEVEGKDTKAIDINKLRQLESNLEEDFEKDHVEEYAKGILFGNPHRLTSPEERETLFTQKVFSAAKRRGIALVHTPDLFPIVQYLSKKNNAAYAKRVRKCFADTKGDVVKFPPIPKGRRAG